MRFEDLQVWQEARILYTALHKLQLSDHFLRDQLLRAGLSVSNNIAEGFERQSNNELKRFLYIAKGSCGEVRSVLYMALDTKQISQEQFSELYPRSEKISVMLYKYIGSLPY